MELPQPRPIENEGGNAIHDFLSLCPLSPAQQDPPPTQGSYLKTHDFLQPFGMNPAKENKAGVNEEEKLPPSAPPSGIGTYSTSYLTQIAQKPQGILFTAQATRNDGNLDSGSYTGNGFTLWDESSISRGQTGKESISAERHILQGVNVMEGEQMEALERQSQSSADNQPPTSHKNRRLCSMMKSAKNSQGCDDDDDENGKEFIVKKELSSHPRDEKPNTSRSKHSATEQRRRSKINDRFQNLREIVPNSDQKRDKASFLSEVIEYIQFLQEKVNRYESPFNFWNHESSKMMHKRNCHVAEGFTDVLRGLNNTGIGGPSSAFALKFDEKKIGVPKIIPGSKQNIAEPDVIEAKTSREELQQPELTSKAAPTQSNKFTFDRSSTPLSPKHRSDKDQAATWIPSKCGRIQPSANYITKDNLREEDLALESGTISISSVYSKRLLSNLTQALQNSGVDLSEANISVKIDLPKRANGANSSMSPAVKEKDVHPSSRMASTRKFILAQKKPRITEL